MIFPLPISVVLKMTLKDIFGTDLKKETEGTWIDICENDDGSQCRMKIASMTISNKKFVREAARQERNSRRSNRNAAGDKTLKQNIKVFVDSVLIGWENVVDFRVESPDAESGGGKQGGELVMLPYSRDNAVWLLNELPNLFQLLTSEANDIANFQEEHREETAKN